jgi:hypothetical protein
MSYLEWLIAQSLRRFPKGSWYRWYDKHGFSPIVRANYFKPTGIPLDVQAEDMSEEYGMSIEIQDIVDFVLKYKRNPWCRRRKPHYDDAIDYGMYENDLLT